MKTYEEVIKHFGNKMARDYQIGRMNFDEYKYNKEFITYVYGTPGGVVDSDLGKIFNKKVVK